MSLGTIVGNIEINDDNILFVQVERARNPTITANFAKNIASGYVVAEVPEKLEELEDLILNTVVNEEYEKAFDYIEKIEEWNIKERRKLEEYELEQGIREEDARKDSIELIFDALESAQKRKDKTGAGALRSSYQSGKWTSLRTTWLLTMLEREGLSDEYFQEDIKAMLDKRELLDEEGTWRILKEQLGIKLPTSKPPEIEIKEVPPLLEELESVVSASYNKVNLEEINLTKQAWDEAKINPQEVYNKVNEGVRLLNSQYMLVKVVDNNDNLGTITLVELAEDQITTLKQSIPKLLKSYFQTPTDVVGNAFALSHVLEFTIHSYLFNNNEEAANILKSEKTQLLNRVIFEKILERKSSLINNLNPNAYDISGNKEETKKYKLLANKVNSAIKRGLLDGENNFSYGSVNMTVQVVELVDTIRYLIDLIPEELYKLKHMNDLINWTKKQISITQKMEIEGKRDTRITDLRNHYQNLLDSATNERDSLMPYLGSLIEGSSNWKYITDLKVTPKKLSAYGLIHNTNHITAQAAKS